MSRRDDSGAHFGRGTKYLASLLAFWFVAPYLERKSQPEVKEGSSLAARARWSCLLGMLDLTEMSVDVLWYFIHAAFDVFRSAVIKSWRARMSSTRAGLVRVQRVTCDISRHDC